MSISEQELIAAERKGREQANLENLKSSFSDHEKQDNSRFDKVIDKLDKVSDKLDNLATETKIRNDISKDDKDKSVTTKTIFIASLGASATIIGVGLAIIEFIVHFAHG
jgi:hypothetical protein